MSNVLAPPKPPSKKGGRTPRLPDEDIDHLDFSPVYEGHEPYPVQHLVGKVILDERVDAAREALLDGSNPLTKDQEFLLALVDDEVHFDEEIY